MGGRPLQRQKDVKNVLSEMKMIFDAHSSEKLCLWLYRQWLLSRIKSNDT